MSNCKFNTTRGATLAYLRTKGVIDKYLNIIDLPKFRAENTKLSNDAKNRFNITERLFYEENNGKKAIPNDVAFRQIDEVKKYGRKISFMSSTVISDEFERSYNKVIDVIKRRIEGKNYDLSVIKSKLKNKDLSIDEKKNLLALKISTENEILKFENRIEALKKNPDIEPFKAIVNLELNEIETLLNKDNLTPRELDYISHTIDLWKYVSDINEMEKIGIFNPDDLDVYAVSDFFETISTKAEKLERKFNDINKKVVLEWGENLTGKKFNKKRLFAPMKDGSSIAVSALNISKFGDNLLDTIYVAIKGAELEINKSVSEKYRKLDELSKDLTKQDLDTLYQKDSKGRKTTNLTWRYAQDYYYKRNDIWSEYYHRKKHNLYAQAEEYRIKTIMKQIWQVYLLNQQVRQLI